MQNKISYSVLRLLSLFLCMKSLCAQHIQSEASSNKQTVRQWPSAFVRWVQAIQGGHRVSAIHQFDNMIMRIAAQPSSANDHEMTFVTFLQAIQQNNPTLAAELLQGAMAGAIEATPIEEQFMQAVKSGDLARIEALIPRMSKDVKFVFELPVIVWVTGEKNDEAIIKLLVQAGFDINSKDRNGFTPLLMIAGSECEQSWNKEALLEWLCQNGAQIEQRTLKGNTALHLACSTNNEACVKKLLELKADPCAISSQHYSTFMLVIQGRSYEDNKCQIIAALLSAGASRVINHQDPLGNSALMLAIDQEYEGIAAMLIGAGADVSLCNNSGESATAIARNARLTKIERLLKAKMNPPKDTSTSSNER